MHLSSLFRPKVWIFYLLLRKPGRLLSDKTFLKLKYWATTGRKLNIDNPGSFNEKLQWLKLYNRRSEYTMMADKYAVREYVKKTIGEEYLIPLLGVWDRPEDIDFDVLPEQFVLKCNHDCGSVIICRDKSSFDQVATINKLKKCLKENYYWQGREWPYKDIKPKIVAEKYMGDNLTDYRIYCFNEIPKLIYSYSNESQADGSKPEPRYCDIFDHNWKPIPYHQKLLPHGNVPMPGQLSKMLEIAKLLSANSIFVRIDFYEIDNMLYVGEMTFYPGGGMSKFYPDSYDLELGKWLKLPTMCN